MLFLCGLLGLALSRTNIVAVILFAACYSILVYRTWLTESPVGLALCTVQSSLVLAFRFKYLTWGDPWFEYSMILKIMKSGLLSPVYYPDQQPALHTLIAAASTYMHTEAMTLQKFLIPAFSAAGILSLYLIARDFFDSRIAIASGLLLSVGTAYVHWISQAATESLGIPMALIAFYLSYRAFCSTRYLPAALIIISSLALTHHLTAIIFVVWINSFALAYLLFVSKNHQDAIRALVLSLSAFAVPLLWWSMRLPSIYRLVVSTVDKILPDRIPLDPAATIVVIMILIYASLSLLNDSIIHIRSRAHRLQHLSTPIYYGLIVLIAIGAAFALNFLLGRSFFALSYPMQFYANGLMMIILAVVGLRGFMNTRGIPFLAWSGGLAVLFLGSILKLYYFEDPLRFIEFIYPSLAVVGAYGIVSMVQRMDSKAGATAMALICLLSLVVAFPSTVFWGQEFPPGDPRYDARAYVIYHPETEIMALGYLRDHSAEGMLHTDRYVGYASLQLENITSDLSIDLLERKSTSVREKLDPDSFSDGIDFVLVRERMMRYAEFGEWLLKEKKPLKGDVIEKLERKTSRIYDNGEAWIYMG
ncbi:MAG: glycosyltransferase family 39 protein [Methanothrix sp.]|uniref:glycosyltransferase family 39 protein n=1 Tax=Methanothrix sp. TaxID=90426 RepID=UPI0032AF3985|nr:glycosyltransferase family 39 protein [Methanothrix sp.]